VLLPADILPIGVCAAEGYLGVTVSNEGPGIVIGDQEKIFESFTTGRMYAPECPAQV
jgi:signal transduction histidine kinase